jgi:hypothetical protein
MIDNRSTSGFPGDYYSGVVASEQLTAGLAV